MKRASRRVRTHSTSVAEKAMHTLLEVNFPDRILLEAERRVVFTWPNDCDFR